MHKQGRSRPKPRRTPIEPWKWDTVDKPQRASAEGPFSLVASCLGHGVCDRGSDGCPRLLRLKQQQQLLAQSIRWSDALGDAPVHVRDVHELLRAAVEHGRLDEIEVELRPVVEEGGVACPSRNGREDHDLEPVDQSGREKGAIKRDTAVGAHGDIRLALQSLDRRHRVLVDECRVLPPERLFERA